MGKIERLTGSELFDTRSLDGCGGSGVCCSGSAGISKQNERKEERIEVVIGNALEGSMGSFASSRQLI